MFAACGHHLVVENGAYMGNGRKFRVGNYVGIGKNFQCQQRIVTMGDDIIMGEEVRFIARYALIDWQRCMDWHLCDDSAGV